MPNDLLKIIERIQQGENPFEVSRRRVYQPIGGRLKRYKKPEKPKMDRKVKSVPKALATTKMEPSVPPKV